MLKFWVLIVTAFLEYYISKASKEILVTSDIDDQNPCDDCLKTNSLLVALDWAFNNSENFTLELLDSEYVLSTDFVEDFRKNYTNGPLQYKNPTFEMNKFISIVGRWSDTNSLTLIYLQEHFFSLNLENIQLQIKNIHFLFEGKIDFDKIVPSCFLCFQA